MVVRVYVESGVSGDTSDTGVMAAAAMESLKKAQTFGEPERDVYVCKARGFRFFESTFSRCTVEAGEGVEVDLGVLQDQLHGPRDAQAELGK